MRVWNEESQAPARPPAPGSVRARSNLGLSCSCSRIFGLDIKGRDCGDEVAQWFTNFLKTESFRLVQFEKGMKGRASKNIFPSGVQNYQVSCQRAALHLHQSLSTSLVAHREPPQVPS